MKKIPTLFVRDQDTKLVIPEVTPGCEWVLAGEGIATQKLDGTCCMVRDGLLYARHELLYKRVNDEWQLAKSMPAYFEPATDIDPNTGKQQGWVIRFMAKESAYDEGVRVGYEKAKQEEKERQEDTLRKLAELKMAVTPQVNAEPRRVAK